MSFHLFFINGWGFESNFWKPTCDLLNLKDIVGSAEILDKNSLNKKALQKIPINTIFITMFGVTSYGLVYINVMI